MAVLYHFTVDGYHCGNICIECIGQGYLINPTTYMKTFYKFILKEKVHLAFRLEV